MNEGLIMVEIEPFFGGNYRLEYDGKYITLFGKDLDYKCFKFNESDPDEYEEMVLVSCVAEVRKAKPVIKEVTDSHIIIDLQLTTSTRIRTKQKQHYRALFLESHTAKTNNPFNKK